MIFKLVARLDTELRDAAEKLLERDPHLALRQMHADAGVRAIAEGNMTRPAPEIDFVGVVELCRIAPGQRGAHHHFIAGHHPYSVEFGFAGAGAERGHRGIGAHQFVDGMRDFLWIAAEEFLIVVLAREMRELQAHVGGDGIQPADKQVEGKSDQLVIVELCAIHVDRKGIADDVVARRFASVLYLLAQEIDDFAGRRGDLSQIGSVEQVVLPFKETPRVIEREIHQLEENLDREFKRELRHEFAFAPLAKGFDVIHRVLPDLVIERGYRLGGEQRVGHLAILGVVRRIDFHRRVDPAFANQLGEGREILAGEGVGIEIDLAKMVHAPHHPRRRSTGIGVGCEEDVGLFGVDPGRPRAMRFLARGHAENIGEILHKRGRHMLRNDGFGHHWLHYWLPISGDAIRLRSRDRSDRCFQSRDYNLHLNPTSRITFMGLVTFT